MDIPEHWTLIFEGLRQTDTGDVITVAEGEIIGTWSLMDGVFYVFTPLGANEHIFFEPRLGMLCEQIRGWYEARQMVAM